MPSGRQVAVYAETALPLAGPALHVTISGAVDPKGLPDTTCVMAGVPGVPTTKGLEVAELSLVPTRGVTSHGYRVEYNEEATKTAIVKVREFLQRTIAGGP